MPNIQGAGAILLLLDKCACMGDRGVGGEGATFVSVIGV